jgi:hypothetical protein
MTRGEFGEAGLELAAGLGIETEFVVSTALGVSSDICHQDVVGGLGDARGGTAAHLVPHTARGGRAAPTRGLPSSTCTATTSWYPG